MKILLVSPLPPPAGGIATWTVRYKKYCEEQNIPLVIVNNALQGSRGSQLNSKRKLMDEIVRSWQILGKLIKNIRKEKPDIIHLNSSCSRFGIYRDYLCCLLARMFKVPVAVQCHCNIEDQIHTRMARAAFRRMVAHCKKVLVLNRFSAEYAAKYAGDKVEVVPNFIDASRICERKNISETIRNAIFVGHVQKEKGVIEILRVAEKLPEIQFTLIGPVHQSIAEMKCSANVELLGAQSHEFVMERLKTADVFLFPSYTEGFANALLEAMAYGLPIIATDVGANSEMIEGKGGIIIPKADEESLQSSILKMIDDKKIRSDMSAWNTEKVQNVYLINTVMERILCIYNMILN